MTDREKNNLSIPVYKIIVKINTIYDGKDNSPDNDADND
jgi:hypothetical protein